MAAKRIHIGSHARFEMKRRSIKPADIVRTIRNPGQVLPSVKGRHVYQSFLGKLRRLLLRVASKVAKYWRTP